MFTLTLIVIIMLLLNWTVFPLKISAELELRSETLAVLLKISKNADFLSI